MPLPHLWVGLTERCTLRRFLYYREEAKARSQSINAAAYAQPRQSGKLVGMQRAGEAAVMIEVIPRSALTLDARCKYLKFKAQLKSAEEQQEWLSAWSSIGDERAASGTDIEF